MKTSLFLLSLCICALLLGAGCATYTLPQITVPNAPKNLDFAAAYAINSIHANTLYTIDSSFVAGASYHTRIIGGQTNEAEVYTGFVNHARTLMVLGSFGTGKFRYTPISFFNVPEVRGVPDYYGHYFKAAVSLNWMFSANVGWINRVGLYWGTDNGSVCYDIGDCNHWYFNRKFLGPFAYESMLYLRAGKNRNLILGGIVSLSGQITDSNPYEAQQGTEIRFSPYPINFVIGWNFMNRPVVKNK